MRRPDRAVALVERLFVGRNRCSRSARPAAAPGGSRRGPIGSAGGLEGDPHVGLRRLDLCPAGHGPVFVLVFRDDGI